MLPVSATVDFVASVYRALYIVFNKKQHVLLCDVKVEQEAVVIRGNPPEFLQWAQNTLRVTLGGRKYYH